MTILTVFAHPDDETILTGGTLALLAKQGAAVHYVCATRGEGGEVGEPPLCTQEELGKLREKELSCAVQALGGASLSFMDYIDPLVGENEELHPYTTDFPELVGRLTGLFKKKKPCIVITHGSNGEYGHPAHLLTHKAVINAIQSFDGDRPVLYTGSANFKGHPKERVANKDDQADLVVDISQAIDMKEAAAYCHRTQNALFVRRSSKEAGREMTIPEVLMKLEGFHQVLLDGNDDNEDLLSMTLANWIVTIEDCDA